MLKKRNKNRTLKIIVLFCGLLVIGSIFYAFLIEPFRIEVKPIQLYSAKLPSGTSLKLVHISDLHISDWRGLHTRALSIINSQQPDVVVITGDVLAASKLLLHPNSPETQMSLENIIRFLSQIKSRYGIYIARGNTEFVQHKELSNLYLKRIESAGFHVLANEHAPVPIPGAQVFVLGADFYSTIHFQYAEFFADTVGDARVYRSGPSTRNSYSHWIGAESSAWRDYDFSGRMRLRRPEKSAIGVTFYSEMNRGYDSFYRLRYAPAESSFQFIPHATIVEGDIDTETSPQADRWYRFRIQVETLSDCTRMRARIWADGSPEPLQWQAEARDTSRTRIQSGTIGLWSAKRNQHYFDDLLVTSLTTDSVLFAENFNDFEPNQTLPGWHNFGILPDGIRTANYGVPESAYKILLFHSPDGIVEAERLGIDLVLAGHTHGGQIRLPLLGAPIVRTQVGRQFISGQFRFNGTDLYVNRGLGTVLAQVRFLARPEITVIHIQSSELR